MLRSRRTNRVHQWESRPDEKPSAATQEKIRLLEEAIERHARLAAIPYSTGSISPYEVPDAAAPLVKAIKRLFGTDIQFVRTEGLHPKLDFNGVYIGGNTFFVSVDSPKPYGFVIGHEFLHHLRQSAPELYERFTPAAARLLSRSGELLGRTKARGILGRRP